MYMILYYIKNKKNNQNKLLILIDFGSNIISYHKYARSISNCNRSVKKVFIVSFYYPL